MDKADRVDVYKEMAINAAAMQSRGHIECDGSSSRAERLPATHQRDGLRIDAGQPCPRFNSAESDVTGREMETRNTALAKYRP